MTIPIFYVGLIVLIAVFGMWGRHEQQRDNGIFGGFGCLLILALSIISLLLWIIVCMLIGKGAFIYT